jgi:hypothetical protein
MSIHCSRLKVCGKELPSHEAECDATGHVIEPTPLLASNLRELVARCPIGSRGDYLRNKPRVPPTRERDIVAWLRELHALAGIPYVEQ